MAYVIRFGHFPGEPASAGEDSEDSPLPAAFGAPFGSDYEGMALSEGRTSSSSLSGANNPFGDEEVEFGEPPKSPKDNLNPFGEDEEQDEEEKEVEEEKQGEEKYDLSLTAPSSCTTTPRSPLSSGVVTRRSSPDNSQNSPTTGHFSPASYSPSSPTTSSTTSPIETLEVSNVTKDHTEKAISVAFNVTRLDLRRLVEDAGRNQVIYIYIFPHTF